MMAKTFRCRPSALMGIKDEYVAFCFDESIFYFGSYIEGELNKIEAKSQKEARGKQRAVLRRLLMNRSRFRDPMAEM